MGAACVKPLQQLIHRKKLRKHEARLAGMQRASLAMIDDAYECVDRLEEVLRVLDHEKELAMDLIKCQESSYRFETDTLVAVGPLTRGKLTQRLYQIVPSIHAHEKRIQDSKKRILSLQKNNRTVTDAIEAIQRELETSTFGVESHHAHIDRECVKMISRSIASSVETSNVHRLLMETAVDVLRGDQSDTDSESEVDEVDTLVMGCLIGAAPGVPVHQLNKKPLSDLNRLTHPHGPQTPIPTEDDSRVHV